MKTKGKDGLIYHYEYLPLPKGFAIGAFLISLIGCTIGFLIADSLLFLGGFIGMGMSSLLSQKTLISISRDYNDLFEDPEFRKNIEQQIEQMRKDRK